LVIEARTNVVEKGFSTLKFKRKDDYRAEHIDFSGREEYSTGEGMDITITKKGAGTVAHIELENLEARAYSKWSALSKEQ
jgi:hypothetical protein